MKENKLTLAEVNKNYKKLQDEYDELSMMFVEYYEEISELKMEKLELESQNAELVLELATINWNVK